MKLIEPDDLTKRQNELAASAHTAVTECMRLGDAAPAAVTQMSAVEIPALPIAELAVNVRERLGVAANHTARYRFRIAINEPVRNALALWRRMTSVWRRK